MPEHEYTHAALTHTPVRNTTIDHSFWSSCSPRSTSHPPMSHLRGRLGLTLSSSDAVGDSVERSWEGEKQPAWCGPVAHPPGQRPALQAACCELLPPPSWLPAAPPPPSSESSVGGYALLELLPRYASLGTSPPPSRPRQPSSLGWRLQEGSGKLPRNAPREDAASPRPGGAASAACAARPPRPPWRREARRRRHHRHHRLRPRRRRRLRSPGLSTVHC